MIPASRKGARLFLRSLFSLALLGGLLTACKAPGGAMQDTSRFVVPPPVVDLEHRPGIHQEQRSIVLPNRLEVLLVSDANANKSSAALDVAVGSLEDPRDAPGLAHYLEHMLFLGTEKYPDVEGYKAYLNENQGYSNAYTAAMRTNYHFQVNPDAYENALDRFSQFFKAPLFDADFMEREKNAVHSEHSKNLDSDYWRRRMVERATHRADHPRCSFSTGDLETLKGATREAVIEFYEKFYSANVMRLCLLGPHSLDELEDMARTWFSDIPDHDRGDLAYSEDVYDEQLLPELIRVKAVTQERELQLVFPQSPDPERWRSKPYRLIGSLIGHEGEGSLLSALKEAGLATGISPWTQEEQWATYFRVIVDLTEEGSRRPEEVASMCFAYLRMLKDEGIPDWYWAEQKASSELEFVYREHWEGAQLASWYAGEMQEHPGEEIESRAFLISEYDPAGISRALNSLQPERFRAVLLSPDLEGLDRVEPHYGTEYSRETFSAEQQARFREAAFPGAFRLPRQNPYMPDRLALLQDQDSPRPLQLLDEEQGEFWFECNTSFGVPRGRLSLLVLSDKANEDPRTRLLHKLYVRSLNESLNEWSYPAREAGLDLDLADESRGLRIEIEGFSQRLPELLRQLGSRLKRLEIDEERYRQIQESLSREFANTDFDQAYQHGFYEVNILLNPEAHHRRDYRELVSQVSLEEVKAYAGDFYARTALEGSASGNLSRQEMKASLLDFQEAIGGSRLAMEEREPAPMVLLNEGERDGRRVSTLGTNHCWLGYTQLGADSPALEAVLRVGSTWLEAPFYGEMRTRQQLGYIVFSGPMLNRPAVGMYYAIQSGEYAADELRRRAVTFLGGQQAALQELDESTFDAIKQAIAVQLAQPDKDLGDRMNTLETLGHERHGRFGWKQEVLAALDELNLEDFRAAFLPALSADSWAHLGIYVEAKDSEPAEIAEEPVKDLEDWRQSKGRITS